ncbi:hypothetical protein Q9K01_11960 [Qipengyuania sp. DY56-A-20]|jgi:hypothetical protein|uniref:DNA methylase N-4/N-6 domain-containing protein n=1 Tax=Qipengyuania benthica TaxID=3067651 RepID=A0ABT9HAL0_9SPHN|nr:hypothetical protein [Qipengyuania sp. DY56-A-20]MDP4540343.1 hypothetical protein [Qipengyuania sp. DY56-A-20]
MMEAAAQSGSTHIAFRDWTGDRAIATVGTNAGAIALPFQEWRRFKEAFAPELIDQAATETSGKINHLVDPFGGSGTTALAGQFLGVRPTTIEVNPYLADLIEAKIAPIDVDAAAVAFGRVVERVGQSEAMTIPKFRGAPPTFVEPGVDGRFIFWQDVARRLVAYRDAIALEPDEAVKRLFKVLLASATVPASNIVVSGKGRRYRRGWQTRRPSPDVIDAWFRDGVLRALYDLRRFSDRKCRDYRLLRGDARQRVGEIDDLDLAVFSPPYPNSFDYTDVYNVELWTLGYLDSAQKNTTLRKQTLRSHVQIYRDMSFHGISSTTLQRTMQELEAASEKLWNRHIPAMIGAYTADMAIILKGLAEKLRANGRIYMVVGDSRYANIDVPIAAILAEISPGLGLEPLRVEPCRSMRASPQQGGRPELAESLVVLERR